ncbi:hypothetical protein DRW07_02540 [Alteromonas sediminis]|uniref:Prepilin-type N-terminal cleavage/methylation domain-containing protein n=1 Tax=Alteromonas sediminis TaxID=2259342 RepID=A0A3N5ZAV3_9ALTE|nr:hypothetical protein [Alteromonas sediminis]RPJ68304.1 hypothetical protein DRW07_02540 [Alteromonas sediminis]
MPMQGRTIKLEKGFSLLEAIVALLLVTMLSMTTFSWISNLLLSVSKIEENALRNVTQRNVTEFIEDINVMARPSGIQELGGVTLQWDAALIEPIKRGKSMTGGNTAFELGLYRVSVTLTDVTGKAAQFEVVQVGYRGLLESPL